MKVLLLGANGQVGWELARALAPLGEVVATTRAQLDLTSEPDIRNAVRAVQPTWVVNAAAYTAVDAAESEPHAARWLNAEVPRILAEEAVRAGAWMVHYSTDYVFDGTKSGLYIETDKAGPKSVYGKTKWLGEAAVRNNAPKHVILRTSWVFGSHGVNFLKTVLRLAQERDKLSIVADQVGSPTSAAMLADVTAVVVKQLFEPGATQKYGTYHLVADGETSWHGYAQWVVAKAGELGVKFKIKADAICPITTAEYPMPAPRPANSRLDTSKVMSTFGVSLPSWRDEVTQVIKRLVNADGTVRDHA